MDQKYIITGLIMIVLVVIFGVFVVWVYSPNGQVVEVGIFEEEVPKAVKELTPKEKIELLNELLPEDVSKTPEEEAAEVNLLDELMNEGTNTVTEPAESLSETSSQNSNEEEQLRLLEQLRTQE